MARLKAFFRKRRGVLIAVLILALLIAPVPCKRAVELETVPWEGTVDFDALVGREVAVLCRHEEIATTEPGDSYYVLGLEQDGVLRTWEPGADGPWVFLTISPARFAGYGLRACYEAGRNRFLFRGVLERGEGCDYHIRLVTWDIAAPVCRPPVYHTPIPSYYARWLFPRDFWWPDPLGGLP